MVPTISFQPSVLPPPPQKGVVFSQPKQQMSTGRWFFSTFFGLLSSPQSLAKRFGEALPTRWIMGTPWFGTFHGETGPHLNGKMGTKKLTSKCLEGKVQLSSYYIQSVTIKPISYTKYTKSICRCLLSIYKNKGILNIKILWNYAQHKFLRSHRSRRLVSKKMQQLLPPLF